MCQALRAQIAEWLLGSCIVLASNKCQTSKRLPQLLLSVVSVSSVAVVWAFEAVSVVSTCPKFVPKSHEITKLANIISTRVRSEAEPHLCLSPSRGIDDKRCVHSIDCRDVHQTANELVTAATPCSEDFEAGVLAGQGRGNLELLRYPRYRALPINAIKISAVQGPTRTCKRCAQQRSPVHEEGRRGRLLAIDSLPIYTSQPYRICDRSINT